MRHESHSLALLRTANPVSVEPTAVRSPQARAAFEQIISEPRVSHKGRSRGRGAQGLGGLGLRARLAACGAGITAATVAIVLLLLSGSAATPAFAGWTARPQAAHRQQITAAIRRCGLTGPVLVEARGPYTAAVFASASGGSACVIGPGMSDVGSVGGVVAPDNRFRPNQIGVAVITGSDTEGHAFVLLAGRVGSAVRAVVIHRRSHTDVTASVKDGWYLAWWPAGTPATYATVTTTRGTHTVALPILARKTASCNACVSSGPSSNGPGSDGVPGPPLIGDPLTKPFHGTLLFNVWNDASRVLVCFHPPANLSVAVGVNGPTGPCTRATLLTRLPPGYPVQRNLLEVFPKGVWEIKLPNGNRRHGTIVFLVVAYNHFRYGQERSELTVTW
jgi:hypothetical protein